MDSIIGKIESVKQVSSGLQRDGKTAWRKFEVVINGETFKTFAQGYEKLVGREGEWPYELNNWTDKVGVQRTDKQLKEPQIKDVLENPVKKQIGASQLDRIENKIDQLLKRSGIELPF